MGHLELLGGHGRGRNDVPEAVPFFWDCHVFKILTSQRIWTQKISAFGLFLQPPSLAGACEPFSAFFSFSHGGVVSFPGASADPGYCVWVSSTAGDSQFVKSSPPGTNPGSLTLTSPGPVWPVNSRACSTLEYSSRDSELSWQLFSSFSKTTPQAPAGTTRSWVCPER